MYIGDTTDGTGLHNMIYEVLYNALNEALRGFANRIDVILNRDDSCTVRDNGRGIPTDLHPVAGISAAELIFTQLHAGGKFEESAYDFPGELHGVGVSVVNALSERLDLRIWRGGKEFHMHFARGEAVAPLKAVREAKDMRGTEVTFTPIREIFADVNFDFARVEGRLRELAANKVGAPITLRDERPDHATEVVYRA
jgi:DNA gyrase subunit B